MRHSKKPRGTAMVVALLTLMVVVLITGAVMQSLLLQRRQRLNAENELQAAWLAEASVERALLQLKKDAAYNGETWRVTLAAHNEKQAEGTAEIRVADSSERDSSRTIEVRAVYPTDSIRRVAVERIYQDTSRGERSRAATQERVP